MVAATLLFLSFAPRASLDLAPESYKGRSVNFRGESRSSSLVSPRGVVDVGPIISLRAPLDQGPELFARLHAGDRTLMKVIIEP